MGERLSRKQTGFLIFLCWLAYMSAYIGRLNYSASLIRIVSELGISRAQGGIVASFFFFAYGAGQLVHGILSRHYNLRWAIPISMFFSAVWNLLMPFCSTVAPMKYLWLLNGFTQSVLWSSLIRALGLYLSEQDLKRAVWVMSTTTGVGTVLAYGISAFLMRFSTWRASFWLASVVLLSVGLIWFWGYGGIQKSTAATERTQERQPEHGKKKKSPAFLLAFCVILLFAILNNLIKDGLTTWTPSILYELYGLPETLSVLLTLGLPLLAICGSFLCVRLSSRIRDHVMLCCVFYGISFAAVGILILFLPAGIWPLTLGCFALSSLAMAAVNNVITSLMPLQLRTEADCGRTAGIANAFCYIGSTISSYALGAMADRCGWNGVFYLLLGLTALALVVCGIYYPLSRRLMLDKAGKIC